MTSTTTTTTTSTVPKTQRRTKKNWTNTNTDASCLDEKQDSWFSLVLYRIHLWTGLYMLNSWEKAAFHVAFWFSTVAFFLYVGVFGNGLWQGLQEASASASQADGNAAFAPGSSEL